MVGVLGTFPADPLLTLTLSEQCLQGTHNEENRKLNKTPEHIIKPFSITVLSIKAKENTNDQVVRNPGPQLPVECSGFCGFTGRVIPAWTRF